MILEGQRHRRVRASDKETARLVERVIAAARLVHPSPSRLPSCPSPNTCSTFRFPPCGVVVISIDGEGNPSRNGQTLKRETLSNGSRSLIRRGEKKRKTLIIFPSVFFWDFRHPIVVAAPFVLNVSVEETFPRQLRRRPQRTSGGAYSSNAETRE